MLWSFLNRPIPTSTKLDRPDVAMTARHVVWFLMPLQLMYLGLWMRGNLDTVFGFVLAPVMWVVAPLLMLLLPSVPLEGLISPNWQVALLFFLVLSMLCQNLVARLLIILIQSFRKRA